MFKHLILKHLTVKMALILAMHASLSFDAYTTNQNFRHLPPTFTPYEGDVLMRPFAGRPSMYPALNSLAVPLDVMIGRSRSRRMKVLTFAAAIAVTVIEVKQGIRNSRYDDSAWREYCYGLWTDGKGRCTR